MTKEYKTTTPTPQFEFADKDQAAPRSVTGLLPLQPYAVQYVDGRGEKKVKICFVLESDPPLVYNLERSVQGSAIVNNAKKWFCDEVAKHLKSEAARAEGSTTGVELL